MATAELVREIFHPESEEAWLKLRLDDVTSTDVPALFGLSPYVTKYELFHRKRSKTIVSNVGNERSAWGLALQDAIAAKIAKDEGWTIRRMDEYIRIPSLGIAASFDYSLNEKDGYGLLEVKNVDSLAYKEGWIVDGDNVEAPPHIELQVQTQLLVSGRTYAYIGALIGGNKKVLIKRTPDKKVMDRIIQEVQEFKKSLYENIEPQPDFQRDSKFIAELYNYAEPGQVLSVKESTDKDYEEMTAWYKHYSEMEKKAKTEKEIIKAKLLLKIGEAEKVFGEGFTITAGMVAPAEIAYHREAYRNFKISWKKEPK